jgi:hypothetical protein
MLTKRFIESIECANSHSFNHVAKEPIAIRCGHSICKSCYNDSKQELTCFHCKKSCKLDLNSKEINENVSAKSIIEYCLKNLFDLLEERLKVILDDFKSIF